MCQKCDEMKTDGPETFYFWNASFDVEKAKELAKNHKVCVADTACFKDVVAYPPIPGKIHVMRISVNPEHLDHVDTSIPIILVPNPKRFGATGEMVIDGHHRIARAIRDGVKELKYVILTVEEMNSILYSEDLRDGSKETKAFLRKRAKQAKKGVQA